MYHWNPRKNQGRQNVVYLNIIFTARDFVLAVRHGNSPATTPKWHILLNLSFSCCLISYFQTYLVWKTITQDIKS